MPILPQVSTRWAPIGELMPRPLSCAKLAKQMLEAGTELDIELTKRLEHPDATANRLTLALPASDETQGDRGFRWRPWKRQMNNRKGLVKLSANSVQWLQTMKEPDKLHQCGLPRSLEWE